MSRDESQHGNQTPDLEDSIDALLDEIDAACADVENPGAPPAPKRLDQQPDDTMTESSEPDDQHGREALDALGKVEVQAQALIEDSIDELLGSEASETEGDEAEHAVDEAAIDAQLEELETAVRTEQSGSEGSSPQSDELPEADELLADIADELTQTAAAPEADTQEDTGAEPAPESATAVEAGSTTGPSGADASIPDPEPEAAPESGSNPSDSTENSDAGNSPTDATEPEDANQTPSAESLADASTLDDLDATLADLGDELLGDFETAEGELVGAESLGDNNAAALLEQLGLDDLDLEDNAAPDTDAPDLPQTAPPRTEQAQPRTPQPEVQSAPPQATTPPAETPRSPQEQPITEPPIAVRGGPRSLGPQSDLLEPEPEAEVRSVWESARVVIETNARRGWAVLKTHGAPLGAKLVLAVNKPLKARPPQLRDSIGYLALWTLLMATILWVYLAFIRESPTPTPTQAPTRVLGTGESVDPLHARGP